MVLEEISSRLSTLTSVRQTCGCYWRYLSKHCSTAPKITSKRASFIDRNCCVTSLVTLHAVKYGTLFSVNIFQSVITSHQPKELLKRCTEIIHNANSLQVFGFRQICLNMSTFEKRRLNLTIIGIGPYPLDGRRRAMEISSAVTFASMTLAISTTVFIVHSANSCPFCSSIPVIRMLSLLLYVSSSSASDRF